MNLLLTALPDWESLAPSLERRTLETDETIYDRGMSITHCVFPLGGIISVVRETSHGTIEVGATGLEGVAGVAALLGVPISTDRIFAQTPVVADFLRLDVLGAFLRASAGARDVVLRYVYAVHDEACQSLLCARFHKVEERCARFLMIAHDRLGSDTMPLKQRFLSYMLGVHRPVVSLAAEALQKRELIRYSRGHVRILDRTGLEQASCECYTVVRENYRRARLRWGVGASIEP